MISIVVPVYNSDSYLQKCIDSIRNQTLKDFECLLIDDGSTDSSPEICDRVAAEDRRFKVFHITNGGVSRARNCGITHSSEESSYIGFVDSDDWIEPVMFETLLRNAQNSNADVSVCGVFGGSKKKIRKVLSPAEALKELFGIKGFLGYSWNKLVRKDLFRNNLYDEEVGCYEDLILFYRILSNCCSVIWDNSPLYHYVETPDSLSRTYGLTYSKDKGLQSLWSLSEAEQNQKIRQIMQSHIYIMYMEICIEYIVHSDINKQGYEKCRAFVRERKNIYPWFKLPFKKKVWKIVILNNSLARLVSKIRH